MSKHRKNGRTWHKPQPLAKKTEEDWRRQMVDGWTSGKGKAMPESYRGTIERSTRGFTGVEANIYCLAVKAVHDRRVAAIAYYFYDAEGGAK